MLSGRSLTRPIEAQRLSQAVRRRGGRILLSIASLIVCLCATELLVRSLPSLLPSGVYPLERFDHELNAYVHGGRVIYNKRGYHIVRTPNRHGFLDIDHWVQKQPDVSRVSFWGDSYVEAVQVPLEATFWRRIPRKLAGRDVETMAFGKSGWGTLNSLLAYRKYGQRHGVDVVIYLFVKNDPGDQLFEIQELKRSPSRKPTAVPVEGDVGYEIRWQRNPDDSKFPYRLLEWITNRSLVCRFVYFRTRLLLNSWLDKGVDQNDLPSTWPADVLNRAKVLTRRILTDMRDEVRKDDRHFAVLYVPRGTVELQGRLQVDDIWYDWLAKTLGDLRVPLIDPTAALRARAATGDAVYDDHWTSAGHEVIATVLTDYLRNYFESDAANHNHLPNVIGLTDAR
jgi:hypothetical protein